MKRYLVLLVLLLLVVGCRSESPSTNSQPTNVPAQNANVDVPTTDAGQTSTEGEIKVLGNAGFDPAETRVSVGQIVVWKNEDPKGKGVVINVRKGMSVPVTTSDLVKPGETYRQYMGEAGEYTFWTVGYGKYGKLVVE